MAGIRQDCYAKAIASQIWPKAPQIPVPFSVVRYWGMSSVQGCPLKSSYFDTRKEGLLSVKTKNLDLGKQM